MKIHFDNVNLSSNSGPNTFAKRLFIELLNTNHQIVESGPEADVSLVFIEPSGRQLAKKVVQRLDGIWFKPSEFEVKNKQILQQYQTADAVVWQSNFDQNMTTRWWGHPKNGIVIHNGIDLNTKITTSEILQSLRENYDHIFVSSSNWHRQKRLKSNIELFLHLKNSGYENSCLIVMGSNPDVWIPSPHVMYTGPVTHETCLSIFSIADWMIHLAWLDHCPNVVIEALSRNVPTICSSAGGTKELVQDYGVILNEKNEYGFELVNYDEPPDIDVKQVKNLPTKTTLGNHINVDIKHAATSYIRLFESLL